MDLQTTEGEDSELHALRAKVEELALERDEAISSVKVLKKDCDEYRETLVSIHNIKEPGEYQSPTDTLTMVQDLFHDFKEGKELVNRLEGEAKDHVKLKEEAMKLASSYEDRRQEALTDLSIAVKRAESAEKEIIRLVNVMDNQGKLMHPLYGQCDTAKNSGCSVCFEIKKVADNVEQYMIELSKLRAIIRRSEGVMRKVIWNKKMQDEEGVKKNAEEAAKLVTEMHDAIDHNLKIENKK